MVVMFVIVVFVVYGTFSTIPTVESYGGGVFGPARRQIGVKLLTSMFFLIYIPINLIAKRIFLMTYQLD